MPVSPIEDPNLSTSYQELLPVQFEVHLCPCSVVLQHAALCSTNECVIPGAIRKAHAPNNRLNNRTRTQPIRRSCQVRSLERWATCYRQMDWIETYMNEPAIKVELGVNPSLRYETWKSTGHSLDKATACTIVLFF